MPADHSKHKFLQDIGTDWVALAANGTPLARAATEDGARRAVPNAAEYITGGRKKVKIDTPPVDGEQHPAPADEPVTTDLKHLSPNDSEPAPAVEPPTEPVSPEPPTDIVEPEVEPKQGEPDDKPQLDHDGDGKPGGSEKGENATASRSRRQRRPA